MKRILRKEKLYKKYNKRGFTLIEMIGVIVLIGLIMIAVLPTMSRLITRNSNQGYESYYSLVEEAAKVYAGNLTDKLGSTKNIGCAQIKLSDLIDGDYIQSYSEDGNVCSTGDNGIKIRNNMGNLTVNFQLRCGKKADASDDFLKNASYIYGTNDITACDAYVYNEKVPLKEKIETTITDTKTDGNDVYITGRNAKNYVWYSGKLWRVVSFDKITETVKVVTVDSITSIYYNHNGDSSYSGSDVETWLNNDFLNSLKDYQTFIMSSDWNSTSSVTTSSRPADTNKVKKERVGLINLYEFGNISNWYGSDTINNTWLLSEGTGGKSLYANSSTKMEASSSSIRGVRPAVVLSADVLVYGGSGSIDNPYIIDNSSNAFGQFMDYLNTRYIGEYVSIGLRTYRIVSTDGNTTKLIGTSKVGEYMYSDNHFDYSASNIRENLEKESIFNSNLIVKGDFCTDTINNSPALYQSSKCIVPERINNSIKVGLPKIGDFFTTGINGVSQYWTINPNTEIDSDGNHYNSTINVVTSNGEVSTALISSKNAAVAVIYLDSETIITGGSGTENDPYTVIIKQDANPYTLTYDNNGGEGCTQPKRGFLNYPWDLLCEPTHKDGYTFVGWYTAKSGGKKITEDTIVKGDLKVYARWRASTYTLTYDSNGGSSCGAVQFAPGSKIGDSGKLCVPTKPSFYFLGWFTSLEGGTRVTENDVINDDMTIYAHWTDKMYTLTYDSNGGSSCDALNVTGDSNWGTLCTPTRTGYTFLGWYTSSSGGEQITASTPATSSLKVYARWRANTYTINFDPNGGTGTTASANCTYDVACSLSENKFSNPSHIWVGWLYGGTVYTYPKTVLNLTSTDKAVITMFAVWSSGYYTLTYAGLDSNSSGCTTGKTVAAGETWGTLCTPSSSIPRYFDGWYTSLNGGTAITSSSVANGDITVYPHWRTAYKSCYEVVCSGSNESGASDNCNSHTTTTCSCPGDQMSCVIDSGSDRYSHWTNNCTCSWQ